MSGMGHRQWLHLGPLFFVPLGIAHVPFASHAQVGLCCWHGALSFISLHLFVWAWLLRWARPAGRTALARATYRGRMRRRRLDGLSCCDGRVRTRVSCLWRRCRSVVVVYLVMRTGCFSCGAGARPHRGCRTCGLWGCRGRGQPQTFLAGISSGHLDGFGLEADLTSTIS